MDRQDSLEIKLTDFGLSCKWSEDLRKELKEKGANKILGTSYYIAP
jgi:serine/threonine protein kinase